MAGAAAAGSGSRRYRLTGIGAFDALFRGGARHEGRWLQLVAMPAARAPGRVGYVIGRKVLKRAVDRNRLRRVLRVVLARARPGIEAYDVIVRLKRPCTRQDVAAIAGEAGALLAARCPAIPPSAPGSEHAR